MRNDRTSNIKQIACVVYILHILCGGAGGTVMQNLHTYLRSGKY